MAIQLISFDLDDTLWAVDPVMIQANLTLYRWLESHAPKFTARYRLEDFGRLRQQAVEQQPEIAHSVTAVRLTVLNRGLLNSGYTEAESDQLTEAAFEVFLQARNQVELFQHAQQLLIDLSQRYRLAALSNGNADVERVGLGDYFEFALNADQVGRAKPHPLMFEQMLTRADIAADEVLHIGDHPEHDIAGAQACGLHTLWVNFAGTSWPGSGQGPDLEVQCLSQIPQKIAEFRPAN